MNTLFPLLNVTLRQLIAEERVVYDAFFSPCMTYRHWLSRRWDSNRPLANFIMLNPSTATHMVDDPTVFRTMSFAFDWGFGGVSVTNIFDYRETDPEKMKRHPQPCSEENDRWILAIARDAGVVVCAWGNDGEFQGRGAHVEKMLRENQILPCCLKLTKTNQPNHPLYLRKSLRPIPMP